MSLLTFLYRTIPLFYIGQYLYPERSVVPEYPAAHHKLSPGSAWEWATRLRPTLFSIGVILVTSLHGKWLSALNVRKRSRRYYLSIRFAQWFNWAPKVTTFIPFYKAFSKIIFWILPSQQKSPINIWAFQNFAVSLRLDYSFLLDNASSDARSF